MNQPDQRKRVTAAGDLHSLKPIEPPQRWEEHLPKEGEDGLFTQSWYAVAMSHEVGHGEVIGSEFLDGRIAIFRGLDGTAHVTSAYCPHLGARLDRGKVVEGGLLQCPFHFFEYNGHGRCVATGIGAAPPPTANLFTFPSVERYGYIWAFNGTEALWPLPDFEVPDERLHFEVLDYGEAPVDPVVVCCNTPDYHHFRTLHGLDWDHPDPDPRKDFNWTDHGFNYILDGRHWNDRPMRFSFGILSSTIYFQQGYLDGRWYGFIAPFKLVRPGLTKVYFTIATDIGDGSPAAREAARDWAKEMMKLECEFVNQDIPIFDGAHFRQGTLTRKDLPLKMYLDMFRAQPRAHPSAPFIR